MTDLARFLFERQADTYEAEPALMELAWLDPDIRAFWYAEADAIKEYLNAL